MASKVRKPATIIRVSDGAGGTIPLEDHRQADGVWPVALSVSSAQAEDWMLHVSAEMHSRNWGAASIGQLDAEINSGSQTITLGGEHTGARVRA